MNIELIINGEKGRFIPVICSDIRLTTQKWGAGMLCFSVLKEGSIDFKEGDEVSLNVEGKNMFFGYVFEKSRTKRGIISVKCYDQMRYLKNKDSYTFSNMTASQIFKRITEDYNIKTGDVEDTKLVLAERVEDNTTLMDILYTALSITEANGYGNFIIMDDYGSLCLKNTKYMMSNLVVDKTTALDFSYKTTIDKKVYNRIKLIYKHDTKYQHILNVFNAQDDKSVKEWGVLQYFAHIDINKVNGDEYAKELLKMYKTKNRQLKITTFGNVNMRAGWKVKVNMDIGDFIINEYMRIKECCHIWQGEGYVMELTLEGGVLDE